MIEWITENWVIKFWATWCWPCKQLEPIYEWLKSEVNIPLQSFDVDEIPEYASKFRIMSVPTLVYMKDWKAVKIESWVKTKEEILNNIKELWIE